MSLKIFHNNNSSKIGGTPLYIIAGQSNCGRSRVSEMTGGEAAIYDPAITNAYMFNDYRYLHASVTSFEALNPGTNTMLENASFTDEFGPETSLAYQLQAYQSKNRYYVKVGVGSTELYNGWYPGNTEYVKLQNCLTAALSSISISDLKLHAFIWMQGENDATNSTWANAYSANLTYFFNQFTNWWVNTKHMNGNFKKVIGRIEGIHDPLQTYYSTVKAAQAAYCADRNNNAVMIDTDSYPRKDTVHYSATGQITFGTDIFNKVKDL